MQADGRGGAVQVGCARKSHGAERDGSKGGWSVLPVGMPLEDAPVEFWKKKTKRKTTRARWTPPPDTPGSWMVTKEHVVLPEAVLLRNAGRGL